MIVIPRWACCAMWLCCSVLSLSFVLPLSFLGPFELFMFNGMLLCVGYCCLLVSCFASGLFCFLCMCCFTSLLCVTLSFPFSFCVVSVLCKIFLLCSILMSFLCIDLFCPSVLLHPFFVLSGLSLYCSSVFLFVLSPPPLYVVYPLQHCLFVLY